MSADKRALDDLDALFRAVPAQASSAPRPAKKLRPGRPGARSALSGSEEPTDQATSRSATVAPRVNDSQHERIMYTRLPAALLPKGFRGTPSTPRGGSGGRQSNARNNSGGRSATALGAAAAIRLTEFVKGVLGGRGDRAAAAAIESRLERKVMHLENVGSGQTEAQSAGARAGRAAGSTTRRGFSGKQSKKMGLNAFKARGGAAVSFRDLLGLHGLWKDYARRLVSQCVEGSSSGSEHKALHKRILAADLQGCYLTVSRSSVASLVNVAGIVLRETPDTFQVVTPEDKSKTIPKHSCAVRLVFGGQVVDLNARALKGRRGREGGGQKGGRDRSSGSASTHTADDTDASPLATAAL